MMAHLRDQRYGKSRVRLSRITRTANRHEFKELAVDISLAGEFAAAYSEGDNGAVIPTDTMKNTIYALAHNHGVQSIESFAIHLAEYFLDAYAQATNAVVDIDERPWTRQVIDGKEQPHCFIAMGGENHWCRAIKGRHETKLYSGLAGLQVLKTAGSGFSGFLHDQYTTLKETDDRIFATTIRADWPCPDLEADWTSARQTIRAAMLKVFAEQYSPSVQATLFQMATAAFASCELIDEISIAMPNQHHLLANLEPLGLTNDNVTFVPTDEPFGSIRATVQRSETGRAP